MLTIKDSDDDLSENEISESQGKDEEYRVGESGNIMSEEDYWLL